MAGFLRRLRRGKGAAPAEEEAEAVPEEEVAPPDVPEAEEAPSAPEEAPGVGPEAPSSETSVEVRSPAATVPGAAMPTTPVAAPVEMGPPPPLPKPEEGASARPVAGGPGAFHSCFLCGSEMDGPWCPTCRMVWND